MSTSDLSPRQSLALNALISGKSIEQVAAIAQVTPRTVRRWQASAEFRASLEQATRNITRQSAYALSGLLLESIEELGNLLRDPRLSPTERLRVINTILSRWPSVNDAALISEKIEELERLLNV